VIETVLAASLKNRVVMEEPHCELKLQPNFKNIVGRNFYALSSRFFFTLKSKCITIINISEINFVFELFFYVHFSNIQILSRLL